MRHKRIRTRLNLKPAHARMQTRNLVTSMFLYEKLRTTKKRAAVIAPEVDRIVNYAKTNTPHVAIRHINTFVTDKNACRKIMQVFTKRYKSRSSGLTRMVAAGSRRGDGAQLVDLEFVDGEEVAVTEVPAAKKEKATVKKTVKAAKTPKKSSSSSSSKE